MNFLTWGTNPWGQEVLIRISWDLLYLASFLGVLFVVAHAVWIAFFAKAEVAPVDDATLAHLPKK